MAKTIRLHYDDPLALEHASAVVAHATWRKTPSVVLDETIFYPESGGQMGDHGVLGDARVVDVQIDGDGVVHHLVEGERPPVGETVRGVVDGARRRRHMALHTGQHALSRALLDQHGAVTVSSRLGETACTLDVDVAGLSLEDLRPTEEAVLQLIDEDRPVRQLFPEPDVLPEMDLRKPPPDAERVRVVDIDGFDITPCGGTHVQHTSQIELLVVHKVERYKKGTRVTFEAGPRARRLLRERADHLADVAAQLRCAPLEVRGVVEGLAAKLDGARNERGRVAALLADRWAERLRSDGDVVAVLDGGDADLLRLVAERLTATAGLVALAAPGDEGAAVLLARGPASDAHCGELMRAIAKATGGRGGGRPELAQGRVPAGIDWHTAVAASRSS